jgi:dethiobiotin synthetase
MKHKFFIIGTDTGVGKTYVSAGLLRKFKELGFSCLGLKPVASGGFYREGKLYNDDALQLQQNSSIALDYDLINPYCFLPAVSPNIAAGYHNQKITVSDIYAKISAVMNHADICIIEGAGGWYAPINERETMADLAIRCGYPVILVVGIKLGCLNHALLTYKAILAAGITVAGWVANCIDPGMEVVKENIATLQNFIGAPCVGAVDYNKEPEMSIDTGIFL